MIKVSLNLIIHVIIKTIQVLRILHFIFNLHVGETVGRWTGTEVTHDYVNQVSSYYM